MMYIVIYINEEGSCRVNFTEIPAVRIDTVQPGEVAFVISALDVQHKLRPRRN